MIGGKWAGLCPWSDSPRPPGGLASRWPLALRARAAGAGAVAVRLAAQRIVEPAPDAARVRGGVHAVAGRGGRILVAWGAHGRILHRDRAARGRCGAAVRRAPCGRSRDDPAARPRARGRAAMRCTGRPDVVPRRVGAGRAGGRHALAGRAFGRGTLGVRRAPRAARIARRAGGRIAAGAAACARPERTGMTTCNDPMTKKSTTKTLRRRAAACGAALAAALTAPAAMAINSLPGGPAVNELNLQPAVTRIAAEVQWLHWFMLVVCLVIFIGVFGVMLYSIVKHRKSVGNQAANFHENVAVEFAWTIVPLLIVMAMGLLATRTVVAMKDTSGADLTIKVTGYQDR